MLAARKTLAIVARGVAAKIPTLSRNEVLHRAEAETVIGEVIFG